MLVLVRHLRYMPLAYLIGIENFMLFLPLLLVCVTIHLAMRSGLRV